MRNVHRCLAIALVLTGAIAAFYPVFERFWTAQAVLRRADAMAAGAGAGGICGDQSALDDLTLGAARVERLGPVLASWQSVGGCGSGASSGTAGGVKWIGRNVRGGLFHVECQTSYTKMPYGYNLSGTLLVTYDIVPRWTIGVGVPYLYKYMYDPYDLKVDLVNRGLGDVNALVTGRFGDDNAWAATLIAGAPTGKHDTAYKMAILQQDRQLGLGKPTASLVLDYTMDNLWGPIVLGGTANWRGGRNNVTAYRTPSASLYSYVAYLLGPFAPAAGLTVTGYAGNDEDRGGPQPMPRVSVSGNLSLEWATDWVAFLLGASFPYDIQVGSAITDASPLTAQRINRFGAWTVALGVAFAP